MSKKHKEVRTVPDSSDLNVNKEKNVPLGLNKQGNQHKR